MHTYTARLRSTDKNRLVQELELEFGGAGPASMKYTYRSISFHADDDAAAVKVAHLTAEKNDMLIISVDRAVFRHDAVVGAKTD